LHHLPSVGHSTYPIIADQSLPDRLPQVSSPHPFFVSPGHQCSPQAVLRLLKHFTTDEREREKLGEFEISSPEVAVSVSLLRDDRLTYSSWTGRVVRVYHPDSP
jgi:hypothetical protein